MAEAFNTGNPRGYFRGLFVGWY